jgi:hypothetical protein
MAVTFSGNTFTTLNRYVLEGDGVVPATHGLILDLEFLTEIKRKERETFTQWVNGCVVVGAQFG